MKNILVVACRFVMLIYSFCTFLQGSQDLNTEEALAVINASTFDDLLCMPYEIAYNADYAQLTQALLDKLAALSAADNHCIDEHLQRTLSFQGKTMRFSLEKIGQPTAKGYPLYIALHGGGAGGSWVNDSQWEAMKTYYRSSINNGIYVAVRGIADTWNLHFESDSYRLYERLIENMIVFENVDSNQVYVLGFSAGGDGVYQIAPRMADRFPVQTFHRSF